MDVPVLPAHLADPDHIAILADTEDVTRAEAWVAARALAVALQAKDPVPGSGVALCATLSPTALVTLVAIHLAGKRPLVLDPADSDEALQRKLEDSPPSTIIVDEVGATRVRADVDDTITFGQYPGLVQTYVGLEPADCPAHAADPALAGTLVVSSLQHVCAATLTASLAAGTQIVVKPEAAAPASDA